MLFVGPSAFTPAMPAIPLPINERSEHRNSVQRRQVQLADSGTSNERLGISSLGPDHDYAKQRLAQYNAAAQLRQDIAARLIELTTDAALASEHISAASLKDLLTFLNGTAFIRRPAIFLLDNGNFRAVWKNASNEQAGFQFRGAETVHCVFFFRRRSSQLPLSRETLIDLIPNLRQKYPSFAHILNGAAS